MANKKHRDTFYFVDIKNENPLPELQIIFQKRLQGIISVLHLDANICLELKKFVENDSMDSKSKLRVQHLLKFILETHIDVLPAFGIIELCSRKDTLRIDLEKSRSLENLINKALSLNIDQVFDRKLIPKKTFETRHMTTDTIKEFSPLLNRAYWSFLKIFHLVKTNGLKKDLAQKNIFQFIDWQDKFIKSMSPAIIQIALGIFGGCDIYRKMLQIDEKGEEKTISDKCWGASFDLLQIFLCFLCSTKKMNGFDQQIIFVTNDAALFEVLKNTPLRYLINNGDNPIFSIHEVDLSFNNYKNKRDRIALKINEHLHKRLINRHLHFIDEKAAKMDLIFEDTFIGDLKF